jgi:CubicO group peptidase (beta-lactamase class C family)
MNGARIRLGIVFLLTVILTGCLSPAAQTQPETDYWPKEGWRTTTPEEQGMDSETLANMIEAIQQEQLPLHSLLIVRNGCLVSEIYAYPYTTGQVHILQSVTKSVIGALTGIAIEQGTIKDIHQPLFSLIPDENVSNLDEDKKAITLENILTLSAGIDCPEDPALGKPIMQASENWVEFMLNQPMVSKPGAKFNYCTGEAHILSAILQKATGMSARSFANQVLFSQIGIGPVTETLWPSDPQGVTLGGYGLSLTPQQMAKIGYLFLNQRRWDGKTVIPSQWIKASTTDHNQGDGKKGYGYLWWIDPQGKWYAALGRNGQHIFVYPAENMVVVFTAALPTGNDADLIPLQKLLDQYILPAVKSDGPLPDAPNAQARLKSGIQTFAQPEETNPSFPATAKEISGRSYAMEDNPFGWQTIVFSFQEGEQEAQISINDSQLTPIGLDNTYRFAGDGENPFPMGFRGFWKNANTFGIEYIVLGTPAHYQVTVEFSGDKIHIVQQVVLTGIEDQVNGARSD